MKTMILILTVIAGSLLCQSCFYGHYAMIPPHRHHHPAYVAPGPPPPPPAHRPYRR
ncbi:MAG: hypothetical protein Q4F47_01430 [Bacteroidaceae bacterium]|nr:hypothetical protein [Bacteroidaceae bacterium]MDO5481698.1 hypothetical protein [Bacteroidaceae bacterium]